MQETTFVKKTSYFYKMFAGQFISQFTSQIVQYSLIWYLTAKTNSPAILAWSTLIAFIPGILFGPFVGSFIDRINKRILMIGADWIVAFAAILIAIFGGDEQRTVIIIFIALFIRSFAGVVQQPTMSSIIPTLVPDDFVPKVGGINGTAYSATMLISPAIGAMLYSIFPLNQIMLLDVIGAIFGTISVLIVPIRSFASVNGAPTNVFADAKIGWETLRSQKGIYIAVLWSAIITMFVMPIFSMYPLITTNFFHGSIGDASIVETTYSIGTLIGGIVLGIFAKLNNRMNILVIGYIVAGLFFGAAGLLPSNHHYLIWFEIFQIPAGVGFMLGNGLFNSLIQQAFPAEKLGRVLSITTTISNLAGPVGLVFASPLEKAIGLNGLSIMGGVAMVIFTLVIYSDKNARALNHLKVQTDTSKK
ncbi:MAG: MFS transporter [Lactobacillaceae bacterium]|jgi:DHA3 family macrolide efflux protein-like MFS transporter|nr:MFS transporter [Lactobacillaceae bacterium]